MRYKLPPLPFASNIYKFPATKTCSGESGFDYSSFFSFLFSAGAAGFFSTSTAATAIRASSTTPPPMIAIKRMESLFLFVLPEPLPF